MVRHGDRRAIEGNGQDGLDIVPVGEMAREPVMFACAKCVSEVKKVVIFSPPHAAFFRSSKIAGPPAPTLAPAPLAPAGATSMTKDGSKARAESSSA